MKIYMTDIVPFGDEKIFAQMLPFITEDRKNKIMQLKKKEDRCRSLAAGLLLEYALREYGISLLPGKMQQMYLRFGEKGKPVLNGKTGIHFNLSHSGRYVAGVFSDEEVGITKGKNEKSRLLFYRVMDKKRKLYQSGWKRDGIGSCIVLCTAGSG